MHGVAGRGPQRACRFGVQVHLIVGQLLQPHPRARVCSTQLREPASSRRDAEQIERGAETPRFAGDRRLFEHHRHDGRDPLLTLEQVAYLLDIPLGKVAHHASEQ